MEYFPSVAIICATVCIVVGLVAGTIADILERKEKENE